MKYSFIIITLIFLNSFFSNAQDSLHYRLSFNASLGATYFLEKKTYNSGHLTTQPDQDDIYGSLSISYLFKKSMGIIASANFTEYGAIDESYDKYVNSLYPEYYILAPFNYVCKLHTIRAGFMYVLRKKKIEIVPQFVAGSYFNFEPVEPEILLKEIGSNKTKSITYHALEVKDKINFSAILLLKWNFKPRWGIDVSGEYYYFKPEISYEIETKELLLETKKEDYRQELNLSWAGFSIGFHLNFLN